MSSGIIQVIFFDLGDTLVRIKLDILQEICQTIGKKRGRPLKIPEYMDAFLKQWSNREIKNVTTHIEELIYWQEFFRDLLENLELSQSDSLTKQYADIYSNPTSFECFEDVHTVLPELSSQGYKLGLISNAFPSALRIINDLHLRNYFKYKYTFLSFRIPNKYIKPEPEIYMFACKKANVDIKNTLFVDDRWPFVEAALNVGMRAYLIERFSKENKKLVTQALLRRIYNLHELKDRIPREINEEKPASSLSDAKQGNESSPPMNMTASVCAST